MADETYDVVILGGGPAGASCALYTSRARLKSAVLDRSPSAGALAVTAKIANYPGVRGELQGMELLETIRTQAADFGAEFVRASVVGVDFDADPRLIFTPEKTYAGRSVVIATGAMGRRERVPGEEEFLGRGVSYCATCDGPFYSDKEVAVVGDTDIALEEALFLTRFARQVHLIAPRNELKAAREFVESVTSDDKITVHFGTRLREVTGGSGVNGVTVADLNGATRTIPVDGVFVLLVGAAPTTDFLAGVLPLTDEGCIAVDSEKATAIQGVYAVGDVTCDHIKQAVVAAAEGVIAALAIDKYLNKRERIRVDYR